MAQEELEKWSPKSIECYRDGLSVEQELSKGGGLQKVTYMLTRGPGGPVFGVLVVMLVLHFRGALTELYFMGLIALGVVGASALAHPRKSDGS